MKYYVYVHKRKGTDTIFYVGKGCFSKSGINRVETDKNRNDRWNNTVKKDGGFDSEIIKDGLSEDEAFNLEVKLISEFGLDNLCNMTEGGEGGDTLSNHPNIKSIGKKISERNSGAGNGNFGKGYYYWWEKKYGKERADELQMDMVKKRSEATKGQTRKPQPHLRGKNNPANQPDAKRKMSESKVKFWKENKKKEKCCKCGKEYLPMNMTRHQKSKNCLGNTK